VRRAAASDVVMVTEDGVGSCCRKLVVASLYVYSSVTNRQPVLC